MVHGRWMRWLYPASTMRTVMVAALLGVAGLRGGTLILEDVSGPPTAKETAALEAWAQRFKPEPNNEGNAWAFGHSGQAIEALGLMYEATGDRALLARMTELASLGLSLRDDLAPAPVGHRHLWPGDATPAWGNNPVGRADGSHAGPESGDVAGRIAYCAYLILKTPTLAGEEVPDGDPHGYGKTYGARARRMVELLDATAEDFVVRWFVRTSEHNRFYYPKDRRYARSLTGQDNSGGPVPWNQQFMLGNCLLRLAQCHALLGDKPERVKFYDACVAASYAWFFDEVSRHRDGKHGEYYTWEYVEGDTRHVEDAVHAGIDLEGIYRGYVSARYPTVLTPARLQALANTVVDVMSLGDHRWAGAVDGGGNDGPGNPRSKNHAANTDFPRPNLLLAAEFRPEVFPYFREATFAAKRTNNDVTAIARLLWARSRLHVEK